MDVVDICGCCGYLWMLWIFVDVVDICGCLYGKEKYTGMSNLCIIL